MRYRRFRSWTCFKYSDVPGKHTTPNVLGEGRTKAAGFCAVPSTDGLGGFVEKRGDGAQHGRVFGALRKQGGLLGLPMLSIEYKREDGITIRTEVTEGSATDMLTIPSKIEGLGAAIKVMAPRLPSEAEVALQCQCEAEILASGQK